MFLQWFLLALGIAALLGSSGGPAAAYTIRQCDPIAENEISLVGDYIDRNVRRIANEFTHISRDNRDEFVRKWPRITIICRDEGQTGKSRECLREASLGGKAHGGPGNRVNICFYNQVDRGDNLCELLNTIVHEFGHANGYPIFANHDNPNMYVFKNDPVYVLGELAQTYCENDPSFNDRALLGRVSLGLGAACRQDDQCTSGRCLGGTCQCDQDGDCPAGQRCFRPAVGANFCSTTDRALGASCTRNDQCRSDRCEGGECVCRTDGDCPTGSTCSTPITGRNMCVADGDDGPRVLGANCTRNDQCRSGRCQGGECVCRSDSDCPSGQSCFTPVAAPNYCESTSLPLGANCRRNEQCRSDRCQGGECTCRRDSDCPGSQRCRTPVIGPNRCE